jgi:uncharacterized protein YnzC (UPF0291/DUF896 family)
MQEELQLRINELAKKKKNEGLTEEEQAEQADLYRQYIAEMKASAQRTLDEAGIPKKNPDC